jgi:hypothetical protein
LAYDDTVVGIVPAAALAEAGRLHCRKRRLVMNLGPQDLIEVMKENWLHMRHIENARLTFTSFYMVFTGAVIYVSFPTGFLAAAPDRGRALLWLLLGFLSALGLMVSWKANTDIGVLDNAIRNMKHVLGLTDYCLPMPSGDESKRVKVGKVSAVYLMFYFLSTAVWLGLAVLAFLCRS